MRMSQCPLISIVSNLTFCVNVLKFLQYYSYIQNIILIINIKCFLADIKLYSLMIQKSQKDIQPFILVKNSNIPPVIARLISGRKEGYVRIANTRWNELSMLSICKSIAKWAVKNLDIEQNRQPQIIVQISQIKFTHLIILNLSSNLIESIEALTLINVRNLQEINLSNNQILSLQSFRKLHTFRLKILKLCNNPFYQIDHLSQMPLMNLQTFVLENDFKKKQTGINLSKLLKIQSFHLKSLYIRNWDKNLRKTRQNGQSLIRDRFSELNPSRVI